MVAGRDQDVSRSKKTLYVTGFDPRRTTKQLLEELFMQGGPVTDVVLLDTHAYVQFQDQDSIPYCIALFSDLELHGRKLRINAKQKSRESLSHLKYLMQVREILREQYSKVSPPKLPPKQVLQQNQSPSSQRKRKPNHNHDREDNNNNNRSSTNTNTGRQGNHHSVSKSSHRRQAKRQSNHRDTVKNSPQFRGARRRR